MTVISAPQTGPNSETAGLTSRARWAVADGLAAAERVLTKLRHDPTAITLTLGAPVVMVLIFGYIFGSAIAVPNHGSYRDFLVPGLFVTIAANIVPSMVEMLGIRPAGWSTGSGRCRSAVLRCRSARAPPPPSTDSATSS